MNHVVIKLLPKTLVNYVKIIKDQPNPSAELGVVRMSSIILIDDDKLVRINWAMYCKKEGLSFLSFKSVDEFLASSTSIENTSRIYIDSNLGDGVSGEIESEMIFNLGFLNLYLATGYEEDSITKPIWIKEIFSKNPEVINFINNTED